MGVKMSADLAGVYVMAIAAVVTGVIALVGFLRKE